MTIYIRYKYTGRKKKDEEPRLSPMHFYLQSSGKSSPIQTSLVSARKHRMEERGNAPQPEHFYH